MNEFDLLIMEDIAFNALIDAYTMIAGVGNGYTHALSEKTTLSKEQIQERFLTLDKKARDTVGDALSIYLNQKEGDKT